ncbi:MAG: sigma-70 family RNA polymerase sigma factor [Planctomycetes bacterium]|nr:sigma-70 family RNA polymerase sigma factor [Planctomycetota bacterium]
MLVQGYLDRLRDGDPSARGELLNCACDRLRRLTRKMLKGYPNVHRWEQTDDVLQNAIVRLQRTLQQLPIETARDFFRLSALEIRRELLDLARHYYGPQGAGAHHESHDNSPEDSSQRSPVADSPDVTNEPGRLAVWSAFHDQVAALPDDEREVFDLLWYQGLSQAEAAEQLHVNVRTIKRRWLSARMKLQDALQGEVPE